jgi:hypothetical protein
VWEAPWGLIKGRWWAARNRWMPPELSVSVMELCRRYQLAPRFVLVAALTEGLPRVTPGGVERTLRQLSAQGRLRWTPSVAGVRWRDHAAFKANANGVTHVAGTNGAGADHAPGDLPADRTAGSGPGSQGPPGGRRSRLLADRPRKIQTCPTHRWLGQVPFVRHWRRLATPEQQAVFTRWWSQPCGPDRRCAGLPWRPRRVAARLGLPMRSHPRSKPRSAA